MSANDTERSNEEQELKKDFTKELRLRADPPRVTRLSRNFIVSGVAISALTISAFTYYGLTERKPENISDAQASVDHHTVADGVTELPATYEQKGVPKIGPPLPGDLGRPMLNAGITPDDTISTTVQQEAQRQAQETEAARLSRLFTAGNVRQAPSRQLPSALLQENKTQQNSLGQFASDETFSQNGQDRKLAFVKATSDRRVTNPDRLSPPASPFIVQAGAIIPGALITGIKSDLPGEITAQVTEHVYDSVTGSQLLIPQGSKLIGAYDSQVAFGQSRVLLVWTRLILPNGKSIVMERQPGSDAAGYSGLQDGVDHHWGTLLSAAALTTLLSIGMEAGLGNNQTALFQSLASGASMGFNQVGRQLIGRNLNIQPTLTIRPGFPVRVIVNRDLVLEPYQS